MDQIGIGVIAAGQMGQRHANVYRQLPEVELRAVADLNTQAAHTAADPTGADVYADWRDLLVRDDIQAVSICLPDWLHRDAVIAAAEAGKHILLEKPLAIDVADADDMVAAVERAGITLLVGQTLHFDPRYAMPLEDFRRGAIGDVIHVYARRNNPIDSAEKFEGNTTVLQFLGIHDIEYVLSMVDEPVVRVTAESHQVLATDLGIDDAVFTLVKFASGAVASFEHAWTLPAQTYRALDARLDAVGTKGMIRIDCAPATSLTISGEQVETHDTWYGPTLGEDYAGAIFHEVKHFVDCLRTGTEPAVKLKHAHEAVRVVDAAQRSAASGKPVEL
ncbi:MAG: Gfo/Idh/MocA family oxidoreductase [Chloroflexi bacterium]|nr:Gfo/Idh/MocA family oxidoreductase [Chloroflexota bacterium]